MIIQFFDTIDQYDTVYLMEALPNLQRIISGVADGVPADKRGPTWQLLHNYVDGIAAALKGNDLLAMRAQYYKLRPIVEKMQENLANTNYPENETLGTGIFAIMMFPLSNKEANAVYSKNFRKAATELKKNLPGGTRAQHNDFYNHIEEMLWKNDLAIETELLKQLAAIEAEYRAGQH